uniref:Nucleotide-binding protein n=1 Tax=uncultured bacterium contig00048 TaxID=1181533 RepID=A0A806KP70_9BACT|nr:nucleotide-binding protein [uncultured bacterium contig00048]
MKGKTSEWVSFAANDIIAANAIINNTSLTGHVAFLCQQAIEKYFKAYLVENNKQIRKIHDLIRLYSEVKAIKDWSIDETILRRIDGIYTESRYPDDVGMLMPTMEDAKSYLEFAKRIENIFRSLVG